VVTEVFWDASTSRQHLLGIVNATLNRWETPASKLGQVVKSRCLVWLDYQGPPGAGSVPNAFVLSQTVNTVSDSL